MPPREGAVPWEDGHSRNQAITAHDMRAWKNASGYHQRSLAENSMYRLKQLFGNHLASRLFESQVTEVLMHIAAMNIMTALGMPVSVRLGTAAP